MLCSSIPQEEEEEEDEASSSWGIELHNHCSEEEDVEEAWVKVEVKLFSIIVPI
jgi:hypothetical protein